MIQHHSDCAVHNEPAYPAEPCDCARPEEVLLRALKALESPYHGVNDYNCPDPWYDECEACRGAALRIAVAKEIRSLMNLGEAS